MLKKKNSRAKAYDRKEQGWGSLARVTPSHQKKKVAKSGQEGGKRHTKINILEPPYRVAFIGLC